MGTPAAYVLEATFTLLRSADRPALSDEWRADEETG
jgi:hypothetical protein